jgi:predicted TIM-barrel fold metal-dependent hydrolase
MIADRPLTGLPLRRALLPLALAPLLLGGCALFGKKPAPEAPAKWTDDGQDASGGNKPADAGKGGAATDPTAAGATAPGAPAAPAVPGGGYDGPIIDVHTHPNVPGFKGGSAQDLLGQMDQAKVSRAGVIVMAQKGNLKKTRKDHDTLLALVRRGGGKFFPVGSVHPDDGPAALKELDRIARKGVKVLKLHPNTQAFDVGSPAVARLVGRAAMLGMVVLFDATGVMDGNQVGDFITLAIKNPKAKLILAHMGGARFHDFTTFGLLKMYDFWPKNVWFDLSATAVIFDGSPYADELLWVSRKVGTDRLLFGSDFPMMGVVESVGAVKRLGFTPEEQKAIFHDNAVALLGLKP